MRTCILSEKPSVAREIAAVVGATIRENGYLCGNGYAVTWALGHLVVPAMPEDYGIVSFVRDNLPIIPKTFIIKPRSVKEGKEYKPDSIALRQLKVIEHLFNRCDKIIVATDAGREGELIFRYIYDYTQCRKPFERLWISSLTNKAITDGLHNLKSGSDYNNLYYAAKARSEADWLVGINSSQALTIAAGRGVFSLGRVQTPTLAMICKRFLENREFVSVPYWLHKINLCKDGIHFSIISEDVYNKGIDDAEREGDRISQNGIATVQSVENKMLHQEPPLLYDLTTLQKEANSKYGFSADKTLSIAQKLYEAKYITYPRTGSRFISRDVFDEIPNLIEVLKHHKEFSLHISQMDCANLNLKSVDDTKVTDHHALLITENFPSGLNTNEQTVYDMIAGRMLAAFSPVCIKEQSSLTFDACGHLFSVISTKIIKAGWQDVFSHEHLKTNEEDGGCLDQLPLLSENEQLEIQSLEILEKHTKPKLLHTEASLLAAMESCGKEIANEAEREAIKECGIGTPATRAAIIETLFTRGYVAREKKSLVPTPKGLAVYQAVKDKYIANVSLTGEWENALIQIEKGVTQPDEFRNGIEKFTRIITADLLETTISVTDEKSLLCPKCKVAHVGFYPQVVRCQKRDCGLVVFRNICEKQLSDKQIIDLLTIGKTPVIKGFRGKGGKEFDAALMFDENYQVVFEFPKKRGKK